MSAVSVLRLFGGFIFAAQAVVNLNYALRGAEANHQVEVAKGVVGSAACASVACVLFGLLP